MKRFARLVTQHPLAVIAAVLLATTALLHGAVDLGTGRVRLEVDPAIDRLLPEGDDERRFYDRARRLFGSDQFVLLALETEDAFDPATLERLARITELVERVPGVQRALSLANATAIEGQGGELRIGPFYERVPRDPAELSRLRERVRAHPLYGPTLVSEDGRIAAVLVSFDRMTDREFVEQRLSDRVAEAARAADGPGRIVVTGTPHVKQELSRAILAEMSFILPSVLGIAALLSAVAFRSARGVALPMGTILLGVVWTLGAMGWTGTAFNLVSNIVPPLVITLGFAAAMHVVGEYYQVLRHAPAADRASHREAVARVVEEMGLAIAVNGLTTVLGFLSLLASRVSAIREFGAWSSVGVLAVTLLSLTFVPASLVLLGPARRRARAPAEGALERFAEAVAQADVRHRRLVFGASLGLLALAAAGIARVRVSTGLLENFFESSPVRAEFSALNRRFAGLNTFYVVVEADEDGAFARPENLRELQTLQRWLEEQPEIGPTASLADTVSLLHGAFRGGAAGAGELPDSERQVKQLLRFGGDDATGALADAKLRAANVIARSELTDSRPIGELLARVSARLDELPRRLEARATGDAVLLHHTVDEIARGQLQSIASALVTIYLTLAVLLTSLRVGLYALLPNLLPIAIYYGTLGLLDVPLNLSTSLVGAITLGIAVDDTVHYFARFSLEARRLGDERRATASTLRAVIRPVAFTTAGLCLGFGTLAFSDLRYQVQFGVLSAFTMAVALALELTLSPAICSRVRLVTLWDLLRLDLGPDPQRSIPLFRGLSARQARIFVLMSHVVSLPEGTRLFSEGERGSEMYVVIDGELLASTARGGARVEFSRMRRGEVVGEVALFAEARTADVDVTREARLLRFGEADLERLGRRYPRVAAKVYRNLNQVLAWRVVTTAQALR